MGISEAQTFLGRAGYQLREGEDVGGLLSRAAEDAMRLGLRAPVARRAIESLLSGHGKGQPVAAFGESLLRAAAVRDIAPANLVSEQRTTDAAQPQKQFASDVSLSLQQNLVPKSLTHRMPETRIHTANGLMSDIGASSRQNCSARRDNDHILDGESPLGWQERALCSQTDPEAFFPDKGGSTKDAKKVCVACEVRPKCLDYALSNDERFGVWGGLSERERRQLKKRTT